MTYQPDRRGPVCELGQGWGMNSTYGDDFTHSEGISRVSRAVLFESAGGMLRWRAGKVGGACISGVVLGMGVAALPAATHGELRTDLGYKEEREKKRRRASKGRFVLTSDAPGADAQGPTGLRRYWGVARMASLSLTLHSTISTPRKHPLPPVTKHTLSRLVILLVVSNLTISNCLTTYLTLNITDISHTFLHSFQLHSPCS